MDSLEKSLPELAKLLEQRLALVGQLAESLAASQVALGHNNAEAIARGAAHQAELCRQWSLLEEQLRAQAARRNLAICSVPSDAAEADRSAQLQAEWVALATRIRYLARVHRSLLRYMQRSLSTWSRVVATSAPTYSPAPNLATPAPPQTGESLCQA